MNDHLAVPSSTVHNHTSMDHVHINQEMLYQMYIGLALLVTSGGAYHYYLFLCSLHLGLAHLVSIFLIYHD